MKTTIISYFYEELFEEQLWTLNQSKQTISKACVGENVFLIKSWVVGLTFAALYNRRGARWLIGFKFPFLAISHCLHQNTTSFQWKTKTYVMRKYIINHRCDHNWVRDQNKNPWFPAPVSDPDSSVWLWFLTIRSVAWKQTKVSVLESSLTDGL